MLKPANSLSNPLNPVTFYFTQVSRGLPLSQEGSASVASARCPGLQCTKRFFYGNERAWAEVSGPSVVSEDCK